MYPIHFSDVGRRHRNIKLYHQTDLEMQLRQTVNYNWQEFILHRKWNYEFRVRYFYDPEPYTCPAVSEVNVSN